MAKVGRKSKLTDEMTQKLVKLIKSGAFLDHIFRQAGISKAIFYRWLSRGEAELDRFEAELKANGTAKILKSENKFVEFLDAIREAEEIAETEAIENIKTHFTSDWRSSAWFLERRYPDRWGRKLIGFASDDGTKDFHNAFANAIKEVEADEKKQRGNVIPIK